MATPTYDPQSVITTWAGILMQGEMDGESVSSEFQEDRWTLHVGAKGFTTLIVNANESAVVTVMLAQSSPTNTLLSAAYAAKVKGPFLMKDLSDTTLIEGADTVIQKMTPIKRGKELVACEWKFLIPKCTAIAGGAL